MGIFDGLFERYQRQQELIARAQHVGNLEDVLELGIVAAQLGLTPEDMQKMARVYLMLRDTPIDSNFWTERVMRAIRLAQID